MKLNKNQRRFFEEAISYFPDPSDVRLKELNSFASERGLIVPTTALKKYCKGDVRGHYDLTKTGLMSDKSDNENTDIIEDYKMMTEVLNTDTNSVIVDKSSYSKDTRRKPVTFSPSEGMNKISYTDYVYVITDPDGFLFVSRDLKKVYKKIEYLFHDHSNTTYDTLKDKLDYIGYAMVKSSNALMRCEIYKKEIE